MSTCTKMSRGFCPGGGGFCPTFCEESCSFRQDNYEILKTY